MMLCAKIACHEQEKLYSLWQNLNFIFGISEMKPASSGLHWCCSSCFCFIIYPYLQFGNNRFKCHRKWLTTEMFSLPETPQVGGTHFEFTSMCLRASAWNFHGALDENSMKIWLGVLHLWIRWILTGNKNAGESWGKRCWTLGAFL